MVNSILVYVFDGRIFCSLLCRNNVDDNSVENNEMDYNRSTAFPLPPRMRRFSMQVTECLIVAFSAVSVVIASILLLRLHPIIGLVLGTLVILFYTQGQSELNVANRLATGMTGIFKNIGLPIVFASIVGGCLLESGAAHRIVTDVVRLFGSQRVAPALSVSAFIMAIPVYFDTVFYLLLPLAKAVAQDRPKHYLMSVMAIIVGATMAHSLVPPTPGPLLVANTLGISVGTMMLGGCIVGGFTSSIGFLYGVWCSRSLRIELGIPMQNDEQRKRTSPPIWLSILPLVIPIAMIASAEIFIGGKASARSVLWQCVGDPIFALLVSCLIGIALMRMTVDTKATQSIMTKSVADAGTILLLTCAGGGFGVALKELGVGEAIVKIFPNTLTPTGLLVMAFGTTALIRGAQGSATVAMTTTVAIVESLVSQVQLTYHPVYLALAIGCGSKPLAWMNDSGFWQVASMTGMTAMQTLKTFSAALTIMGCVGFVVVLLGSWFLPLI